MSTVIEHVLARLKAIGVSSIFGVPGDYAFPVEDAIVNYAMALFGGSSSVRMRRVVHGSCHHMRRI